MNSRVDNLDRSFVAGTDPRAMYRQMMMLARELERRLQRLLQDYAVMGVTLAAANIELKKRGALGDTRRMSYRTRLEELAAAHRVVAALRQQLAACQRERDDMAAAAAEVARGLRSQIEENVTTLQAIGAWSPSPSTPPEAR